MKITVDSKNRSAEVWMSNADQKNEVSITKVNNFIEECRKKKIFVCVYESGTEDVLENTKVLLKHNLAAEEYA